jgi:hypothetical protein
MTGLVAEGPDLPTIPDVPASEVHSLRIDTAAGCRLFRDALATVHLAAATEVTRYALTGVRVRVLPDFVVEIVATDGRRVHRHRLRLVASTVDPVDIVIPGRSVDAILAMLRDANSFSLRHWPVPGAFRAHVDATVAPGLRVDHWLHGAGIAGRFPDVDGVIPSDRASYGFTVHDVPAFRRAVKALAAEAKRLRSPDDADDPAVLDAVFLVAEAAGVRLYAQLGREMDSWLPPLVPDSVATPIIRGDASVPEMWVPPELPPRVPKPSKATGNVCDPAALKMVEAAAKEAKHARVMNALEARAAWRAAERDYVVALNPQYLDDALASIPRGCGAVVDLRGGHVPVVVRPQSDGADAIAVVMPITYS